MLDGVLWEEMMLLAKGFPEWLKALAFPEEFRITKG
jgi:hypothetical protein